MQAAKERYLHKIPDSVQNRFFRDRLAPPEGPLKMTADDFLSLVPQKIYDISTYPEQIGVPIISIIQPGYFVTGVIAECDLPSPVSDPEAWDAYYRSRPRNSCGAPVHPSTIPDGVDPMHAQLLSYIREGQLTLFDRPLFVFSFMVDHDYPKTLIINCYYDRPDLRGQGIGRRVWENISELARQKGFTHTISYHPVSDVYGDRLPFFTEVLGRRLLSDIPIEEQTFCYPPDPLLEAPRTTFEVL